MAIDCVGVKEGHGVTDYNMVIIKEHYKDFEDTIKCVAGVLVEGSRDVQANWTQPFQNESIASLFQKVGGAIEKTNPNSKLSEGMKKAGDVLETKKPEALLQARGGTGERATYHSRQVWEGNSPHSFNLQIAFFAQDSEDQVTKALQRLEEWICPELFELKPGGRIPARVSISYPNCIFTNCVIKSMSTPITQPKLKGGHMLYTTVSLQIETIQMLNRSEIAGTF